MKIEISGLVIRTVSERRRRLQGSGQLVDAVVGVVSCARCEHTLGQGLEFESPGRAPIVLCVDCVIELVEGT